MISVPTPGTPRKLWRTVLVAWMIALPLMSLSLLTLPSSALAALSLDPNMDKTWKRTDQFVADGKVSRSWVWGPTVFNIRSEEYEGSPAWGDVPAGQRLVAYYDKSRMEINNPSGDRNSKYYVTNGLLVKELISGKQAFGDLKTVPYLPAEVPVSGDSYGNPKSPTYASLNSVASLVLGQNSAFNRSGQTLTSFLEREGGPQEDLRFASYNVKASFYDNTFGHNIADVFWTFINSQGPVLENGQTVNAPVIDWLFSTGYALTEPYWTVSRVGGTEKDVLIQCFERRCYSYTPSNPAAFQVEMGNVGRHYYEWRYNTPLPNCRTAPVRGFGKLWAENPSVKQRISCPFPYQTEQSTKVVTQRFERGQMIFVESSSTSYFLPYLKTIFILFNDGSWATVQDTWNNSQPESGGLTPPPGLFEPKRGFGNAWRNETGLNVRNRLGWAIEEEVGSDGAVQNFYNGLMVWIKSRDEIFVGYKYYNRTPVWETYLDTFEG